MFTNLLMGSAAPADAWVGVAAGTLTAFLLCFLLVMPAMLYECLLPLTQAEAIRLNLRPLSPGIGPAFMALCILRNLPKFLHHDGQPYCD